VVGDKLQVRSAWVETTYAADEGLSPEEVEDIVWYVHVGDALSTDACVRAVYLLFERITGASRKWMTILRTRRWNGSPIPTHCTRVTLSGCAPFL
jgi:hypothetical protein